jgi:glycosyltransferase involved in cell wall biosynthesis
MARLYASVDAFVLPSLSENLPNTIMEAMACGTPCVGFRVGGIPEMIDHLENGYLANYKDSEDLAKGILYVLDEANHERLATNARQKIINCYGEKAVASRYIEIYGNEQ